MRRGLFDDAPFIRLAIPFAAGIALQEIIPDIFLWVSFIIGIVFLILHTYSLQHIELRFRNRFFFSIAACALLITAGGATMRICDREKIPEENPNSFRYAIARIDVADSDTSRSIGSQAIIIALVLDSTKNIPAEIPTILRIENTPHTKKPETGDLILFTPRLAPIANKQNPEAFDYATLMRHRGYIYTQYLPINKWTTIGHTDRPSLKAYAESLRDHCLKIIDNGRFTPHARSILKALLLGYTEDLDQEQRDSFSTAGLSHVLAVSGLHLGIIWAVIAALLAPLAWLHLHRVRAAIILVLLWGYAFLTGLSPSVIRACIMVSVVLTGILIGRRARPMNSLFIAAFGMLLYNPHYLFQVSFQLSFLSVFTILLFYKPIYNLLPHSNYIAEKAASLLSVSAAAQIGTLPLVIYYFHELPLLGLLTNLIIVPLLPILLGGGFLWLLLSGISINIPVLTHIINGMADGLDQFSRLIERYDWSSIQNIWVEPESLILWFILIFGGAAVFLSHQVKGLIGLLSFVLFFLIIETFDNRPPLHNALVIYQESGGTTTLNFIDNGMNTLFPLDTFPQRSTEREARRFWIKNGIDNISFISDSTTYGNLRIELPYIAFQKERIIVLGDDRWQEVTSHERMSIDYAIVVPGFKGKIDDIRQIFDIREIVLAHNLPYFQQKSLQEECRRLRISCHRIRTDGAFIANTTPVKTQMKDAN